MKAFGVRLAAGAATILLGAIMAAQAQKDQQSRADSSWNDNAIPPAKPATPIDSGEGLASAEPWQAEQLQPFEAARPASDTPEGAAATAAASEIPASDGVQLVQHTEPAGTAPGDTDSGEDASAPPQDSTQDSPQGLMNLPGSAEGDSAAAGSSPQIRMSLPSFDELPPTEANAPPAISMGLPVSSIRFAETPTGDSKPPNESIATPAAAVDEQAPLEQAPPEQALPEQTPPEQTPLNGLRGAPPSGQAGLAGEPAGDAMSAGNRESSGNMERSGLRADSSPALPAMPRAGMLERQDEAGEPAANSRVVITDSVRPDTGVPAPLLTPLKMENQSGSGTTLRIQGNPPVKMEIGSAQAAAADPSGASGASAGTAGMQADAMQQPMAAAQMGQPLQAGTRPMSQNTRSNPAGMAPAGSPRGSEFGASAVSGYATPSGYQSPARAASGGGSEAAIYQAAGYKSRADQPPPPSGPTAASPGERSLDGPQAASLVVHKRAPEEVKVGKPASFVITVKNVGGSKAMNVRVHDRVPTGMTLTDATPRPDTNYRPELVWDLGDLEPDQERTITLQLTPQQEGELGSVARVTFEAAASVRTISTRPELKIVQKAPEKVLIGQQLEIELELTNPGTGVATGVVIQEDVPAGLEHPKGTQLDNLIGSLGPGEVRRQILSMRAVQPGVVQNTIRVKGDDGLEATHTVAVEVIAPELQVKLSGPSRRYLERQATYELELSNVGTADATNVELAVQLDRGFTFVKTDFEGQYDSSRHAVFWSLPVLPVGQTGVVPLTLLPVEEGNRVLKTKAEADLGVKTETDTQVEVSSLAELTFSIADTADPIEVGGETTFEIRINNTGSRDDTNVRVALQLPAGMELSSEGDFVDRGQGTIEFAPRALLKANDEVVYRAKARGSTPGRHLVKAVVTSDQSNVPVTKEESIMVYADQ
jgi:uncharacterized repeat protein (TIGR01451 family)